MKWRANYRPSDLAEFQSQYIIHGSFSTRDGSAEIYVRACGYSCRKIGIGIRYKVIARIGRRERSRDDAWRLLLLLLLLSLHLLLLLFLSTIFRPFSSSLCLSLSLSLPPLFDAAFLGRPVDWLLKGACLLAYNKRERERETI